MEPYLRFAVHLKGEGPLPLTYREGLQAALYSLLPPSLGKRVHNQGFPVDGRPLKLLVFSQILGLRFNENRSFHPDTHIRFLFASPVPEISKELSQAIQKRGEILLYGKAFPVLWIEPLPLPKVTQLLEVRTLSPITAYRTEGGKTRYFGPYFGPHEAEFSQLLEGNLNRKARALGLSPGRLEVWTSPGPKRRLVQYKGFWIEGWEGNFLLKGDAHLLRLALLAGLGPKGSQGFGYILERERQTVRVRGEPPR